MRWSSILPVLAAAVSAVPGVYGWGAAGHEIVATIAQIHLHPGVLPKICTILNYTSNNPNEPQCHLAPIATWADRVRYKMRWSAGLHYIGALGDHPRDTCTYPGERGWAGREGANVLGGIRNTTTILQDWVAQGDGVYTEKANEALKFLVHFLGDMHMPLHLTGRDRGGNSVKVAFDGRQTNLHSAWDNLLVAKALRTVPSKYSHPLPSRQIEYNLRGTIYDGFVRRVMWEGILGKWKPDIEDWVFCPAPPSDDNVVAEAVSSWSQMIFGWRFDLAAKRAMEFITPLKKPYTKEAASKEFDDEYLCPFYWSQPTHALNCKLVWPKEIDLPPYHNISARDSVNPRQPHSPYFELDTPEYAGVVAREWILENLFAQAGIRLAGILNWIFMDPENGMGVAPMNL
ncbi:hypothetical protein ONZ45_g13589 [Pleurotus djamor]|nr:hypothetical protein ONZ45_g13589 [Pleurotus djamor]